VSNARDILIAVDLSASMATRDVQAPKDPSGEPGDTAPVERLVLMRDLVGDFIERRAGDRVALIGFATEAYLIVPLTYDVAAAAQMLSELNVGLPGRRTDIGRAIGLAVQSVKDQPAAPRVLAILSDGQTNAGSLSALDAADLAAGAGIEIHMIGFAAEIEPDNAAYMREIAERAGGALHLATTAQELEQAYANIEARVPPRSEASNPHLVRDLAWMPSIVALALACWLGWREFRLA
jgi:Ca-activated chloride channel family protein